MFIEINGKSVKTPRCLVKKAVEFYGNYLLGPKLAKNINLTVEFDKTENMDNDYAYCDWVDNNHRARVFVVTVDRGLSKKETLLALAHEMVHVKQYAKGELKDIFRPAKTTKWLGQEFTMENQDYWELPWEIEAYGRERGLYIKFLKLLELEKHL